MIEEDAWVQAIGEGFYRKVIALRPGKALCRGGPEQNEAWFDLSRLEAVPPPDAVLTPLS
ncbi:hypothetical protein [Sphingomonas nostoxanthinifaciens]|uniref:hypothetical protein n=1 Tax=Sphingomonas nostoxanthinifaciens TaxID=2872652 RepID=UPI001CC1FE16|nr:hypothetical protein [Sphingomonas nostoxanthinifaciens]UAK23693.1 hypothetical protein K8P63_15075 [Sphingomonas nostoxanthinifaciens]